jgi:hypothetical protein
MKQKAIASKRTKAARRKYPADKPLKARRSFLFPLQLPLVRSEANPLISRLCKSIAPRVRCPIPSVESGLVVGNFGGPKGGQSHIDDLVAKLPVHLRVTFILQRMENEIVSGNGVTIPSWATWETHSPDATVERLGGGPFSVPVPGPGEVWPLDHANNLYDALVHNGCGATPVFRVEFHSTVGEQPDLFEPFVLIGEFLGVDNTTLQPNGFWTFSYTIRATGTNGGTSDFKFRGIVSVTCTNIVAFPP